MTPQEKGNWIRRIFTLGLVLVAGGAGLYFAMPDGWLGRKDKAGDRASLKVGKEQFAQILASKNKLTVLNMRMDGNPDSEKLRDTLKKLDEEKYDDRVLMAELDVDENPELAAGRGVKKDGFTGQIDFYANGKKLEQLIGQTDPVMVEKTIDRLLAKLVLRFDKDWLPDVHGMQRVHQGQDANKIKPAGSDRPSHTP